VGAFVFWDNVLEFRFLSCDVNADELVLGSILVRDKVEYVSIVGNTAKKESREDHYLDRDNTY
jgi:hypothetical protein